MIKQIIVRSVLDIMKSAKYRSRCLWSKEALDLGILGLHSFSLRNERHDRGGGAHYVGSGAAIEKAEGR